MFTKHYAPNRCEPSIEALNFGGGGWFGLGCSGWGGGGGQGGCERRIEVFVKLLFFCFGGGGQGGCERRIEV